MKYLNPTKSTDGAYPALQSAFAQGLLEFDKSFMSVFYPPDKRFAGFVDITDDGKKVLTCEWNEDAYQAYAAAHPESEEEPPAVETTVYDELDAAYQEGVNSAYDQ